MPTYDKELAAIHHAGFSEHAESAARGVIAELQRKAIDRGLVVDAGCGSGVFARAMVRAGFQLFGFDPSPQMIALAREKVPEAEFAIGSLGEIALPPCVAVTAMGEVVNYAGLAAFRRFAGQAAAALAPEGMLFFDAALTTWEEIPQRRVDGDDWSVIIAHERHGSRLLRRIFTFRQSDDAIVRDDETHTLELFDHDETLAILHDAGFRVTVRRSYGSRRLPSGHSMFRCTARRRRA